MVEVFPNNQKVILCYGDSNTWGFEPTNDYSSDIKKRFNRNIRWPGVLQNELGSEYYIIEEGLNGRTTNLEYKNPPDRNGKTYLAPCLYSHAPIDLVILFLGGNDLKIYFNRSANDIMEGLRELILIIQTSMYGPHLKKAPQILIVSPNIPLPICESFLDEEGLFIFKDSIKRSKELIILYENLAQELGAHFLDVSQIKPSEIDGGHLDASGHGAIANLVKDKIIKIFSIPPS